MRRFPGHDKFASVRDGGEPGGELPRGEGENRIREHGQSRSPKLSLAVSLLVLLSFLISACGGADEETGSPEPAPETTSSTGTATTVDGGEPDEPFVLNEGQPVPPDLRAAYERGSPLLVQFYKPDEFSLYPQGQEVDSVVDDSVGQLNARYREVEFFSYEIDNPGEAENSAGLQPGQYGTLAAQMGVGLTPYVAMLAPQGEGEYVYDEVFEGYVTRPLLDQALSRLAETRLRAPDSGLVLEQAQTTGEGGGLEYVTVANEGTEAAELGGYELGEVDPDTGEPTGSGRLTVDDGTAVQPGSAISIGRAPDVEGADEQQVAGTFGGGASLELRPGDQLALIDRDGGVAATITL